MKRLVSGGGSAVNIVTIRSDSASSQLLAGRFMQSARTRERQRDYPANECNEDDFVALSGIG